MLKYNNRPSIKYIFFTAICTLLASPMLQAGDDFFNYEYKGETIHKGDLTDKQQKGIDDYKGFLEKETANNDSLEGSIMVQFNGKLLLNGKLKEKATFKDAMENRVGLGIKIKDIQKSLKEKKGDSFDIKKNPVSRKELTAILRKELDIDKLEKDTGLHASLKLCSFNAFFKKPQSISHMQGIQRDNIFNVLDGDMLQLMIKSVENRGPKALEVLSNTRFVLMFEGDDLNSFGIFITIELETPAYRRKRIAKKWGKRILIGTAIASPFLLLARFFYGYGKKSKVKKRKGAGNIALSSTSKTTTAHASTEKVSTEAGLKKRHSNKSKRKNSA